MNILESCTLCPRNCQVNRKEKIGICGEKDTLHVARASLHMWEEPCLSGKNGSGTVFFSGCNLHCIFCQNHEIAASHVGKDITVKRLAEIFLELQNKGANNINLVTATHFVPPVIQALELAKAGGLHLPIVYNTSGYETVETLRLLEKYIDIYLPDYKYVSPTLAKRFSHAEDYPEVAFRAIEEMVRQVGNPVFSEDGMMQKGVIVRHLVLPFHTDDSMAVLQKLHDRFGDSIYISIMSQYTPCREIPAYPELNRKLTTYEYQKVVKYARKIGITNGFLQCGEAASESFIPDFDCSGV